jgi:ParB-like chromosome segregation protein Spo0J
MKTELVKIETLVFDPANARKHGEKNLAAIKSSLQRFGQQKPIVVDANGVVRAGNGTLAAAKALGWKEIAIVRSPLSGSEATAYAIADNRSSELAEWDDDSLAKQLSALQIENEKLASVTGFDQTDIDQMILGMIKQNGDDEESEDKDEASDDSVSIIVVMSIEQEIKFKEAIRDAKSKYGVKTVGDAVCQILEEWSNG